MSYINKNYWEEFYKKNVGLNDASTFSEFISQKIEEFNSEVMIIDLGCGTGKDSFYFAKNGFEVIGVDGSKEVTKMNNNKIDNYYLSDKKINFYCADLSDKEKVHELMINFNSHVAANRKSIIFYTRFFLHAIPEEVEDVILEGITKNIKAPYKFVAEFRTKEDEGLDKVYNDHYRRYVDTDRLLEKLLNFGFSIKEFSKDRGYSIYKNEDPYLARLIVEKK